MKLNKRASPNTTMDEEDVVTIKRVFSALGYYQVDPDDGADTYPDAEMFDAVREYQKDHGLPPTGEIRKNDPLIDQIEEDLNAKGQKYVQRCQDDACDHCQEAAGTVHDAYTEVFEHPNCRCYLEPIESKESDNFNRDLSMQVDDFVREVEKASETKLKQGTDNYLSREERRERIKSGMPMRLDIKENPNETGAKVWYEYEGLGVEAVQKYDALIEQMAERHNVDPDLVRATMYIENSTGHKFGGNAVADKLELSKSVMPMNIRPNLWGDISGSKQNLNAVAANIEAGTILLGRIEQSIIDPTPEKVGTLWNGLSKDQVSGVGARIGRAYEEKPWLHPIEQMAREEDEYEEFLNNPFGFRYN